ncbi:MAG: sugar phosphate isomerase/epimerase family protein, partial [Phycisphaeraceae bacterium]
MHANHDLPTVAISQFTTMTRSFEDDLVDYRNAGICAIEVCETKMSPDPEAARQQLQRVVDAGFEIASVQPRVHSPFPDEMAETPEDPADRRAAFEKTIDLVADVVGEDSQTPLLTITGKAPQHNFRESWQTAAAWYRDVADAAAKRGLRIAFEPLHPTHANINTFITSLDQARRMLAEVGRPNFGLCFDTFNSWEERDLPLRLKRLAPSIFLFQAC